MQYILYGFLDYIPPLEFKQQWLAKHPDYCTGALPSAPRDLSLDTSKQNVKEESRAAVLYCQASATMTSQRSGCVPAEPYPLAGEKTVSERNT